MKEKLKKLEDGGERCQLCINVPKYLYRDAGTGVSEVETWSAPRRWAAEHASPKPGSVQGRTAGAQWYDDLECGAFFW